MDRAIASNGRLRFGRKYLGPFQRASVEATQKVALGLDLDLLPLVLQLERFARFACDAGAGPEHCGIDVAHDEHGGRIHVCSAA